MKDYSLVLSGGGALGYAHLGILSDIHDKKLHQPSEIIGTSMGAIIGAAYACGNSPDDIYSTIKEASKLKNWVRFSLKKKGMFSHRKILKQLNTSFKGAKMSDTKIPLKLIATNKVTGMKKVFDNSDTDVTVADAVVASMALPTLFPDKKIGKEVFIDGCYSSNCSILEATHDTVVVSNVLGWNSFNSRKRPDLEKSLRIMIANQTQQELNQCKASNIHYFDIQTKDYGTLAFSKIADIKELGRGLIPNKL